MTTETTTPVYQTMGERLSKSCTAPRTFKTEQHAELSRLLHGLKEDMLGAMQLGEDGVMRSFTADRDIIDAVGLSPAQIDAWFDRVPVEMQEKFSRSKLRGVDGRKVSREDMYKWPNGPPAPMSKEKQAEVRARIAAREAAEREEQEQKNAAR